MQQRAARLCLGQVLPCRSSNFTTLEFTSDADCMLSIAIAELCFLQHISLAFSLRHVGVAITDHVAQPAFNGGTRSRTGIIGRNRVPDNH